MTVPAFGRRKTRTTCVLGPQSDDDDDDDDDYDDDDDDHDDDDDANLRCCPLLADNTLPTQFESF